MIERLIGAYEYFLENQERFWSAANRHITLSVIALGIGIVICVPLGIWISRRAGVAQYVINFFNALRVLPSLVILFLSLPYLGLGFRPALIALTVLAFPPILINTYAGMRSVERSIVEAAAGMGMSSWQQLLRVEIPLALPAIIAGIRTSSVEVIASATLAAFIGGGGFGDFIVRGFGLFQPEIMLVGAIPVALLAIFSEVLLSGVQRWFSISTA